MTEKTRSGIRSRLMMVSAMAALAGGVLHESDDTSCDIGPEPHEYTPEEGREVARQIAEQRKAKKRRRRR